MAIDCGYTRKILYTSRQLAVLRVVQNMRTPSLCNVYSSFKSRSIDGLFAKGAIAQHNDTVIITDKGKWALQHGSKRIVEYHRRDRMGNGNITATFAESDSGTLDKTIFDELKHDCLDYHKDMGKMPEVEAVQAWGELSTVSITRSQAQSIVKAARKELSNA